MTSAAHEKLFLYCKLGDLFELKKLFEAHDLDIDLRDKWDSTPLYYACLCGHEAVVQFLLQNGAKCKAASFDGERCLYGALTDKIRNMLRNWKQISSVTMRRENYFEFMQKMLGANVHKDITFDINGEKVECHRCVLCARSKYFSRVFSEAQWQRKKTFCFCNDNVDSKTFEKFVRYLYCGVVDININEIKDIVLYAKRFKVDCLVDEIEHIITKIEKYEQLKPSMSQHVNIITIEGTHLRNKLQQDMWRFAQHLIPMEMRDWIEGVLPFPNEHAHLHNFADLCFMVEGSQFMCHKAFMCTKSSYFEALLANHFNENSSLSQFDQTPVINLHDISPVVFKEILMYIYSETLDVKSFDVAYEILTKADMMLLPDLKRACGNVMAKYIDKRNVFDMYKCSQLFQLKRLENSCAEYFAKHIESMVDNEDFISLVESEAYSVENREEADSIPIVDDIRYHISSKLPSVGQIEEANRKLNLVDNLLDRLGIEG